MARAVNSDSTVDNSTVKSTSKKTTSTKKKTVNVSSEVARKTRETYTFAVSINTEEGILINKHLETIQETAKIGSYVKNLIKKDIQNSADNECLLNVIDNKLDKLLNSIMNESSYSNSGNNLLLNEALDRKLDLLIEKVIVNQEKMKRIEDLFTQFQSFQMMLSGGMNPMMSQMMAQSQMMQANNSTSETVVDRELTEEEQIEKLQREADDIDLNATGDFAVSGIQVDEEGFSFD